MTEKKRIRVVSAAIVRQGRYLITQRNERAVLPLLWEFPGGKVEPNESDSEALRRELSERVGADTRVGEHLSQTQREYEKYVVELHLYRCEIVAGEPHAKGVRAVRWVTSSEFSNFEFTPADETSMDALLFGTRRAV